MFGRSFSPRPVGNASTFREREKAAGVTNAIPEVVRPPDEGESVVGRSLRLSSDAVQMDGVSARSAVVFTGHLDP